MLHTYKIIKKISGNMIPRNITTVLRPSHCLKNMYNTETALFIGGGGSTKLCVYIHMCHLKTTIYAMWGEGGHGVPLWQAHNCRRIL